MCIEPQSINKLQQQISNNNPFLKKLSKGLKPYHNVIGDKLLQLKKYQNAKGVQEQQITINQFFNDNRTTMNKVNLKTGRFQYPYCAIGILLINFQGKYCIGTAFIVGDNLVLTCAHNVYNKYQSKDVLNITFIPSFDGQKGVNFKVQKIFYPEDFKTVQLQNKNQYQYALLYLGKDVKLTPEYGKLGFNCEKIDFEKEQQIMIWGYDKDKFLKGRQGKCNQHNQYTSQIFYQIFTQSGQSGSPILIKKPDGSYQAIGIHINKRRYYSINCGVKFSGKIRMQILDWISSIQQIDLNFESESKLTPQQHKIQQEMQTKEHFIYPHKFQYKQENLNKKIFQNNLQNFVEQYHIKKQKYLKDAKSIIVLWGITKSGLSTVFQAFNQIPLRSFLDQDGEIKFRTKGVKAEQDIIGNTIDSKTTVFNFHNQIIDMGGVIDSREIGYQIIKAYMRRDILKQQIKFKFCLIVQESGLTASGVDFIDTIKSFLQIFEDFDTQAQKIINSTVMLISKAIPKKEIKFLNTKFKYYLDKNLAQFKPFQKQFKKLLAGLIDNNKIMKFQQPKAEGQTFIEIYIKQNIQEKANFNQFSVNPITSYTANEIKKLRLIDNGQSFNQYLILNYQSISIIQQGLSILQFIILNILKSFENIFNSQIMKKLIPFIQKHQTYLNIVQDPDFIFRANYPRERLGFIQISNIKQLKVFNFKKFHYSSQTSATSGYSMKKFYFIAQIVRLLLNRQYLLKETNIQNLNKCMSMIQSIIFYLTKIIPSDQIFQIVRFYYVFVTKLNFLKVFLECFIQAKDQQINQKFLRISPIEKIQNFFFDILEKIINFLKQNIPFEQELQNLQPTDLIKAYYALKITIKQNNNVLQFEPLLKTLKELKQKEISYNTKIAIKLRIGQILYLLSINYIKQNRIRIGLSHLAEALLYLQQQKQNQVIQLCLKIRELFAYSLENVLCNCKQNQENQLIVSQTKLNFSDLIQILQLNNQVQQQLRIYNSLYKVQTDQDNKVRIGLSYFKRLIFYTYDQAAQKLINNIYEIIASEISKRKIINEIIIVFLKTKEQRVKKYINYLSTMQLYKKLPVDFLYRFYLGSQKPEQSFIFQQSIDKGYESQSKQISYQKALNKTEIINQFENNIEIEDLLQQVLKQMKYGKIPILMNIN